MKLVQIMGMAFTIAGSTALADISLEEFSVEKDNTFSMELSYTPRALPAIENDDADNVMSLIDFEQRWLSESIIVDLPAKQEALYLTHVSYDGQVLDSEIIHTNLVKDCTAIQVVIDGSELLNSVENEKYPFQLSLEFESIPFVEKVAELNKATLPEPAGDLRFEIETRSQTLVKAHQTDLLSGAMNDQRFVHHGTTLKTIPLSADEVAVFIPRRNTLFDTKDAFFVSEDINPSAEIKSREAFINLSPSQTEVSQTRVIRLEEDHRLELYRDDKDPGNRFFWERNQNPGAGSYSPCFQHSEPIFDQLTEAEIKFRTELWGATTTQHTREVTINGDYQGDITWLGKGSTSQEFTIAVTTDTTTLDLDLCIPVDPSGFLDRQATDWIEYEWTGYPKINDQGYTFIERESTGNEIVTVGGFDLSTSTSDILILDVTNEYDPELIQNPVAFVDSNNELTFEFESLNGETKFLVQRIADITVPDQIEETKSLPVVSAGQTLRGVYVSHEDYHATLNPLLTLRGPEFVLLDPEAAYDSYNGGQESPFAIREAIKDLFESADNLSPELSICLIGKSSLDFRDNYGLHALGELPSFVAEGYDTSLGRIELGEDFSYGLLFGEDNLMDAFVGRIPATSTSDLQKAIDRIIAYENSIESLLEDTEDLGLFVLDNDSQFQADGTAISNIWTGDEQTNQLLTLASASTSDVKNGILNSTSNNATLLELLVYLGHGSNNSWASERILDLSTPGSIPTNGHWPFVASLTCLNHFYYFPGFGESLGERWLFTDSSTGALMSIATSMNDRYSSQKELAYELVTNFDASKSEINVTTYGEVLRQTFNNYIVDFPEFSTTLQGYLLFGDPASKLRQRNLPNASVDSWIVF